MPIYEYHCAKCGKNFEIFQLKRTDEKPSCPNCNGEDVKKLLSAGNIHAGGFALDAAPCSEGPEACGQAPACGCCCGGHGHSH